MRKPICTIRLLTPSTEQFVKGTCIRTFLCCFWIAAALAASELARGQSPGISIEKNVHDNLTTAADILMKRGYRPVTSETLDRVSSGEGKNFPIQLTSGVNNAIIAACGQNCDHVEATLYNFQHKELTKSDERQPNVIIYGNPSYSGLHEVQIAVPGCHESQCDVGLMVFRQQSPEEAPAIVKYKRYDNRDLWSGDISTLRNIEAEDKCAAACDENKQCRAYSFDKWRHACYLKSETAGLTFLLDPSSITGVRDGVPIPPAATTPTRMQRYQAKILSGSDYKTIRASQLGTCEAACMNDGACIAYTRQKNGGLCRLFDSASGYSSSSDNDSGVKVQDHSQSASIHPAIQAHEPIEINGAGTCGGRIAGSWDVTADTVFPAALVMPSRQLFKWEFKSDGPLGGDAFLHGGERRRYSCQGNSYTLDNFFGITLTLSPDRRQLAGECHDLVSSVGGGCRIHAVRKSGPPFVGPATAE